MSRKCDVTGKGPVSGHNVSKSKHHTKRKYLANVTKRKIFVPELGRSVTIRVSAKGLKIIDKVGLNNYLKKTGRTLNDIM